MTSEGCPLTCCQQIELGTACGKLFRCSTMSILDAGKSEYFVHVVAMLT